MSRMQTIVVCDVETTGLSPSRHRIVEVALARVEDGNWGGFAVETFRVNLTEREYAAAELQALMVNGYRLGHPDWEGAPLCDTDEARELYGRIAARLHKAPLVNARVNFDADFLSAEFARHAVPRVGGSTPYAGDGDKRDSPWEGVTWNVEAFSRELMRQAGRKGWKLHTVYEEVCKGPALPEHRAEADVLRALWVMAEGRRRCPKVWPDFFIDPDPVSEAVERWAKGRLQTTVSKAETPAGVADLSKGFAS